MVHHLEAVREMESEIDIGGRGREREGGNVGRRSKEGDAGIGEGK